MNSKEQLKSNPFLVGFIGGGLDSAIGEVHFIASQMDRCWKVVAGCFSREDQANVETGVSYGINTDRVYKNWQEMLQSEVGKLDAVIVLTPIPDHREIIEECFRRGYAVISEKALSNTSIDASAIVCAQKAGNHFLAVTYNYSSYPMVREMRHLIEIGAIGTPLHFQVEMPQEGYLRVDQNGHSFIPQSWRLQDGSVPTVYLDLAAHLYQLTHYLLGEKPQVVIADHDSFGSFDVVDHANVLCRYASGLKGSMWFGKSSLGNRNGLRIRLFGSEGSLDWLQTNPEELVIARADGSKTILDRANNQMTISQQKRFNRFKSGHPSGYIEAFANLYVDMADCLAQYQSAGQWHSQEIASPELDISFLQFAEAMTKSIASGKWEQAS